MRISIEPIVKGNVMGKAIVCKTPFSFLGGVNPQTGIIVDPKCSIFNQTITDKIFVFPEGKGSTVGSYVIYALKINGVAPKAFIANKAETIVIAGAILAEIPLVHKPDVDILTLIKTDDVLRIDSIKKEIKKY